MDPGRLLSAAVPPLLKSYWILATASVLVTLLPLPLVPESFRDAVRLSACRGKLWHNKPAALGALSECPVPQAWFLHFYVIGAVCNLCALLAYASSCCHVSEQSPVTQARTLAALLLFQMHLMRRALETRFVMRYPKDAKMHVIAYIFGLSYYAVVPLSIIPDQWYMQHGWKHLGACQQAHLWPLQGLQQALALGKLSMLLGILVFVSGNVLQFASHYALAQLSRQRSTAKSISRSQQAQAACGYKLPQGLLFDQVSCPHYLAEIMVYVGLALMTQGRLTVLLMLAWVTVNLVLAACATHEWYKQNFKSAYPSSRRALIPAVFLMQ